MTTIDAKLFSDWVGRTVTTTDDITAAPLRGLSVTLDRDDPPPGPGTPLPPLWHWLYFWPLYRPGELRPDGHAHGGEFMPPIPLPRRMWAGSRFIWERDNALRVGDRVTRSSTIESIRPKSGRSGELVFVRLIHRFHNERGLALTNEHDAAFRGAARPSESPPVPPALAPTDAPWQRTLTPDAVLLFRYAALTFNAHRIHYDVPYATQAERYPALLVQGPLLAILLTDLLRRHSPDKRLAALELKALRPTFEGRALRLYGAPRGAGAELWAADHEGALTMKATAQLE